MILSQSLYIISFFLSRFRIRKMLLLDREAYGLFDGVRMPLPSPWSSPLDAGLGDSSISRLMSLWPFWSLLVQGRLRHFWQLAGAHGF